MSDINRKPRPFRYPREKLPRNREECLYKPRPCLCLSCPHNLLIDIDRKKIKVNFKDINEVRYSCALDEAAHGGMKLEDISKIYGLSRERIRQIIEHALRRMRFIDGKIGKRRTV